MIARLENSETVHPAHETAEHSLPCARLSHEQEVSHGLAQHAIDAQDVLQHPIEPSGRRGDTHTQGRNSAFYQNNFLGSTQPAGQTQTTVVRLNGSAQTTSSRDSLPDLAQRGVLYTIDVIPKCSKVMIIT